jgi:CBS domain-containing protein
MTRSVKDAMTPTVASVSPGQTIIEAARMMRDEDVGSLPVTEDGRLVGIVTDRDLVIRVLADGRDPEAVSVREACSRETVSVEVDQKLDEALRLMAHHQVRRLPVVDADDRLIGIVAQADVSGLGTSEQVAGTLEEISRPASQ